MSVRETTPTRRPDMRAPGSAEAEMEGPLGAMKRVLGVVSGIGPWEAENGSDWGVEVVRGGVSERLPVLAC